MLRKLPVVVAAVMTLISTAGGIVEAGTIRAANYSSTGQCCFDTNFNNTCDQNEIKFRCSIEGEATLKKLANVTNTPTGYRLFAFLQNVELFCENQGGNAQPANGQPFLGQSVQLNQTDVIDAVQVTKNGTAVSEIIIHDADIVQALLNTPGVFPPNTTEADLCPSGTWTVYPLVHEFQPHGQLFTNANNVPTCDISNPSSADGCVLNDALGEQCFAPAGATIYEPFDYVGANGVPPCDTLCHNVASPPGSEPACPNDPPQELPLTPPFFP